MIHNSEIDLPNLMSERNYAQLYLNGKKLLVGSIEVNLKKSTVISNHLNPIFCRKYLYLHLIDHPTDPSSVVTASAVIFLK